MGDILICRICNKEKSLNHFYIRNESGKYRTECIECYRVSVKEYNKKYKTYGKYKEWKKTYDKEYRKTDKYKEYQKLYNITYRSLDKTKRQQFANNLRKYWPGLSTEDAFVEYLDLIYIQDNKCAICKSPETRTINSKIRNLSVDHCHKTGKVRGLLCCRCNISIGRFCDSEDLLRKASEYLKKSKDT